MDDASGPYFFLVEIDRAPSQCTCKLSKMPPKHWYFVKITCKLSKMPPNHWCNAKITCKLLKIAKKHFFLVTITCIWSKSLVNCQKDKNPCILSKIIWNWILIHDASGPYFFLVEIDRAPSQCTCKLPKMSPKHWYFVKITCKLSKRPPKHWCNVKITCKLLKIAKNTFFLSQSLVSGQSHL